MVAALVAKDLKTMMDATESGAQTVTLLKIPPGRLPLRGVTASYDSAAAPYARTAGKDGTCEQRWIHIVAWTHPREVHRAKVARSAAEQLRHVLMLTANGGGRGMMLRMSKGHKADMDQRLISPAAFKRHWGCSISRPAHILNIMPHLREAEAAPKGMDAAPKAWSHSVHGSVAQCKELEAAVHQLGRVDPLLVDAMGLPLKAHRRVLAALGVSDAETQTAALVQLQKALLDQRQHHARRTREHAINMVRASGVVVNEPIEALMEDSHSMAACEVVEGEPPTCWACHPRSKTCTMATHKQRCGACGACGAAAAKHYCPFMTTQDKWRIRPNQSDRAEATAAAQVFKRHDGCGLGCGHSGGKCFGSTVQPSEPEEHADRQQQRAQERKEWLELHGLRMKVLTEQPVQLSGRWLEALGAAKVTTLNQLHQRLNDLATAVTCC